MCRGFYEYNFTVPFSCSVSAVGRIDFIDGLDRYGPRCLDVKTVHMTDSPFRSPSFLFQNTHSNTNAMCNRGSSPFFSSSLLPIYNGSPLPPLDNSPSSTPPPRAIPHTHPSHSARPPLVSGQNVGSTFTEDRQVLWNRIVCGRGNLSGSLSPPPPPIER